MVVPPHLAIECEAQILSVEAIRGGMTGEGESPRWYDAGSDEEDNLCFEGVKGESTISTPSDQAVHRVLNTCHQYSRVRTPTEYGAIIGECSPDSIVVIDESYGLVEGQRPKGRRADSPLRETHTSSTFGTCVAVVISHISM